MVAAAPLQDAIGDFLADGDGMHERSHSWSMIFSENRYPLVGIMRSARPRLAPGKPGKIADRPDGAVEAHGHTILALIWRPRRQARVIRLSGAGKCDPGAVHRLGNPLGLLGPCALE